MASNGSYQTYDQVGIAEDISDIISNISPTKTPFSTAIGNEKITHHLRVAGRQPARRGG
jgi:hypothetical protein